MRSTTTLLPLVALLAKLSTAGYVLQDDYGNSDSFFDKFTFFTGSDPTHGFVQYVDQATAENAGLIHASNGEVYIGVDHTNVASGSGRQSVRITSTNSYTHGLFIVDLAHMPGSICGAWPAFWMVGANWPNNGEIDIIEGVNQQTNNAMTLHTNEGCTIDNSGFTGTLVTSNCWINAPGQSTNAGCSIDSTSSQSYGTGFNNAGGGVYATEWTSNGISIWFFPRGSIPADISSGSPDPSTWGTPAASFGGSGCDIDSHFGAQQIVFDTTFCGDWAGNVWSSGSCASLAGTCQDYVANNPSAFAEAYWYVNSLKVYQDTAESTIIAHGPGNVTSTHSTTAPVPFARTHRIRRHGHGN
uniref:endo-1,3(4)-beta-glucanase n=1 Tax=Evansstolkia leycettana TaxID=196907 RepID=A0A168SIC2_9EURO|nr:endo-beta-1,3-1,4-glucanase [Evansstolkia leycettana]